MMSTPKERLAAYGAKYEGWGALHNSIGVAEISAFNLGRNAALARVCPIRESKS
jgi:hypothetical protein